MTPFHLRIARPVTDLQRSYEMYHRGLGLEKIGEFKDHQSFSGIMMGHSNFAWHLEFTVCHSHPVKPQPSAEDLLVLYLPDGEEWQRICDNAAAVGFTCVASFNPYWDVFGKTFIDHDGYRVVLQNRAWV